MFSAVTGNSRNEFFIVRYLSTISWFIGAGAYVVIDNRRKRAGDAQEASSDADDDDGDDADEPSGTGNSDSGHKANLAIGERLLGFRDSFQYWHESRKKITKFPLLCIDISLFFLSFSVPFFFFFTVQP